jgi:hypothetical protein
LFREATTYDIFINPTRKRELQDTRETMLDLLNKRYNFATEMMKNPNNTQKLYEILWTGAADSCDNVIMKCILQGKELKCDSLFYLLPNAKGPCCTFNAKQDMYKDSQFSQVIWQHLLLYTILCIYLIKS